MIQHLSVSSQILRLFAVASLGFAALGILLVSPVLILVSLVVMVAAGHTASFRDLVEWIARNIRLAAFVAIVTILYAFAHTALSLTGVAFAFSGMALIQIFTSVVLSLVSGAVVWAGILETKWRFGNLPDRPTVLIRSELNTLSTAGIEELN